MHNNLIFNPACTGQLDIPGLVLLTRHQWIGLEGAPSSQILTLHSRMKDKNIGIGLCIENDRIGPVHQMGFYASYSYTIKITRKSKLSMGLRGGLNTYQINLTRLHVIDQGDYLFTNDLKNPLLPNFGIGFYYTSNNIHISFSSPELFQNDLTPDGVVSSTKLSRKQRHYFLSGGGKFILYNDIELKPSLLIRIAHGAAPTFDLSAIAKLKEKFELGIVYRVGISFGGMIHYPFRNGISLGYAYDFSTKYLKGYNSGTHELFLGYNFQFNKKKTISPRIF